MSDMPDSGAARSGVPLEHVACALCGADDTALVFRLSKEGRKLTGVWPDGALYNIVSCRVCGLVYVNPRVSESASDLVYANAETEYFQHTYAARARAYADLLRGSARYLGRRPENLLDIGAGDGVLLKAAHELGMRGVGTESTAALRSLVRQELGEAAIWEGAIAELAPETFDVIAILNVLEHVHFPSALVGEIAERLRPGGIVYVHVPNFGGPLARLKGARWHHLEPMGHLYYFTRQTLMELFKRHGLAPAGRFNLVVNSGLSALAQRALGSLGIYVDNGLGVVFQRPREGDRGQGTGDRGQGTGNRRPLP